MAVADEIAGHVRDFTIVVVKSTVPVGTGDSIADRLAGTLDKSLFEVVSNLEFLREGNAIADFTNADRVVIGTQSDVARGLMRDIYETLEEKNAPIIYTDRRSAELTKYAANAFLAPS